jgi:hypothetical protein
MGLVMMICCGMAVQWMGLVMMICCGMAVKRMGMLRVSVREMKALTKDRDSDTDCNILCVLRE